MSATTVPIPPTSRSALAKYWLGIALLVAAGLTLAYWGTADMRLKYSDTKSYLSGIADEDGIEVTKSGLLFKVIRSGEGASPTANDVAIIELEGKLRDGTVFQEKTQGPLPVTGSIAGFSEALQKMQKGGQYKFWISPALGYGGEDKIDPQTGQMGIPGNSVLIFEVTLNEFMSREKYEKAVQAQQEAMQKAQQQGGMPDGPGGPPPGG